MTKETIKKTIKLYGDTVTVHFDSRARNRYIIEETGNSPVGVTTILQILSKPGLMTWPMTEAIAYLKTHPGDYDNATKAYLKKSDAGKDTGTDVHAFIEKLLGAQDEDAQNAALLAISGLAPDVARPARAFVDWMLGAKPKVLASEQIIYSKEFDYCGTYDALLEIDGKVVLCDVKTNNTSKYAPLGIYPEMFLQLGAYALAHHEENPLELIEDAMIIRVGKDGVLNTLRASQLGFKLNYLQDSFKHVAQAYRFMTPLKKQLSEMENKNAVKF